MTQGAFHHRSVLQNRYWIMLYRVTSNNQNKKPNRKNRLKSKEMAPLGHKAHQFLHECVTQYMNDFRVNGKRTLCRTWTACLFIYLFILTLASNAAVVFPLFLPSGDAGKFPWHAVGCTHALHAY